MRRGLVIAGVAMVVGAALVAVAVWLTGRREPDSRRGLTQWTAAITVGVLVFAGFTPVRGLWRWMTNPNPNDRMVRVDGAVVGCYHVYQSPADPMAILRQDRFPEPVVLAYDRPAQPVFNSVGLPGEFDLVLVAPDNTVYGTVSLPPGIDYRQPVKPIHLVVVYARNTAPTTAHVITVGAHC